MRTYAQWTAALRALKDADREASFELYKTAPAFGFRTQRGRVHWMVFSPVDDELCRKVVGEGWTDSVEEAWAAAVGVVGTDRLYLTTAGQVSGVVSDRAEQRRQERMAAKKPDTQDAAKARWVYSYNPSDYYRGADPYPYRRHRVLRETKQFLFVSAEGYGEAIDAKGETNPNAFKVRVINSTSSKRVLKSELVNGGPAAMGSGWSKVDVWSDLDLLVERVRAWSPQRQGSGEWREVLGLPSEEHLEPAQVKRAYRASLLLAHPDHGGSREQFEAVQTAYELAKRLVEAG